MHAWGARRLLRRRHRCDNHRLAGHVTSDGGSHAGQLLELRLQLFVRRFERVGGVLDDERVVRPIRDTGEGAGRTVSTSP